MGTNTTAIGVNNLAIAGNTTAIGANAADIALLQTFPLGSLPTDVAQNTSDISNLAGVVGGNLTDIGSLQTDVGKLQNGMTGYIPRWDLSDTLGISSIFEDASGHVGIATTSPVAPFHVNDFAYIGSSGAEQGTLTLANLNAPAALTLQGGNGVFSQAWWVIGDNNGFMRIGQNGAATPSGLAPINIDTNGNVSVGMAEPNEKFHVENGIVRITRNIGAQPGTYLRLFKDGAEEARIGLDAAGSLHLNGGAADTGGILIDNNGHLFVHGGHHADYVFNEDYPLMPLDLLGEYITNEKHLPNIPSAEEVKKNGLDITDFQGKLLEKVEELTLYTLAQQNQIDTQHKTINNLTAQLEQLNEGLKVRLRHLEVQSGVVPVTLH